MRHSFAVNIPNQDCGKQSQTSATMRRYSPRKKKVIRSFPERRRSCLPKCCKMSSIMERRTPFAKQGTKVQRRERPARRGTIPTARSLDIRQNMLGGLRFFFRVKKKSRVGDLFDNLQDPLWPPLCEPLSDPT